jgi:hypothetical protein
MSKAKAFLYSLGAPILYMLLQLVVLIVISMYLMTSAIVGGTIPTDMSEIQSFSLNLQNELFSFMLPALLISGSLFIFVMWLRHRKTSLKLWTAIGATKDVSAKTLCLAAFAGLTFHIACQGFIQAMPVPQNWHDANNAATQVFADINFLSIITASLFVPFIEEVVFRGFTQRILHHAFTPWSAVIIQGAIFGMFHTNMLQASYAFVTGILIGYIYMKTRNLLAAVCFHAAFNSANYLMVLLFGEYTAPNAVSLALMAAGGATLTLFLVKNIGSFQKEEEIE